MSESTEAQRLWIKSYQATDRDPITRRFCRSTGLSTPAAVGTLHMLWWWVLDWAQDGDISKYHDIDIADAVSFEGEPEVLMRALIDAGYVVENQSGREIANWFKIGGQIIESKKKDAERKAEAREKKRLKKEGLLDVQGTSTGHPSDSTGTSNGVPPEVRSIDKELDLDLELDINKDLKIYGDADPNQKSDQEPNQNTETKSKQTADESKATNEAPTSGKNGSKGRQKPVYEPDSPYMKMAVYFKSKLDELAKVLEVDDLAPKANMQTWADDFRKLVELDKQTDKRLIVDVMDWLPKHEFWRKNVLSASTFRDKWTTLLVEMRSGKTSTSNKGSGGGGRGYGNQKQVIPISQDDGTAGTPSTSEFDAMMKKAADLKASKLREKEAFNNR
ncbi:hypothetical protein [Paenibacillus odorifer]|uniref:hypothetical protein n=1 Tax=Paenibacillus TaxID=44249 RepID=UPI00096EB175|nr:hypothetical protein [Paenibacillus odorifer]OMC93810.1 hypothetical protein BJP46_30850 [Paenibacillus odorifer]